MPVIQGYSAVGHFPLPYNEVRLESWARRERERLAGRPTFATIFAGRACERHLAEIIEVVRIYGQASLVLGGTATGLVANGREHEGEDGFVVGLYHFPDTEATVVPLEPELFDLADSIPALRARFGSLADEANAWLLLASPESMNSDAWLPGWDEATGAKPTIGGFASLERGTPGTLLFCNGELHAGGAVALALKGRTTVEPLVAQGCRPVGDIWTVTRAENNIIHQIGNRPILEVLRDTLEGMSLRDQRRARGNIFIGVVHDEYKTSYRTGDFLVRNLAAIDPKSGAVAIATPLRVGQNLQFQIRDATVASNNLERKLDRLAFDTPGREVYGGCLFTCIGRGSSLFGVPDHDASLVRDAFPGLPLSGLFCNGEFGPVGRRTLLHGYAASLGLFAGTSGSK